MRNNLTLLNSNYKDFILSINLYRYFITVVFNRDYSQNELYTNINLLLRIMNRNIFNTSNSNMQLKGWCFIESSSSTALSSQHCHIIIEYDKKLDSKQSFIDLFYQSIKKIKSIQQNYKLTHYTTKIKTIEDETPYKYVTKIKGKPEIKSILEPTLKEEVICNDIQLIQDTNKDREQVVSYCIKDLWKQHDTTFIINISENGLVI